MIGIRTTNDNMMMTRTSMDIEVLEGGEAGFVAVVRTVKQKQC